MNAVRRAGCTAVASAGRRGRATRRWLIALARCVAVGAIVLALSGCVGNIHLSFLDAQGPIAAEQRWHFYWVLAVMGVLVAGPIFLVLPFFLWRYRYGNKASRYTPKWAYSRTIEILSWGGPIIIVGVLAYFVWTDSHRLDPYKPLASNQPVLHVQVIGYDWKWLFIYPDQGIATIGTFMVPAGRPVAMQLTSATVMQSFFIPSLGSQIYAMGGMVTQLHLEAAKPGRFLGENTMYNGNGFHKQKFTAVALSPDEFSAWVKKVRATAPRLDARVFKAIARRDTRAQLVDDLPANASHDGSVYLSGVTRRLFPEVVKATLHGAPAAFAHRSMTADTGAGAKNRTSPGRQGR